MSKKVTKAKPCMGYGWVGLWRSGHAGWYMPEFVHPDDKRGVTSYAHTELRKSPNPERVYLCKVTVTPVLDKLGRPITRIVGGK